MNNVINSNEDSKINHKIHTNGSGPLVIKYSNSINLNQETDSNLKHNYSYKCLWSLDYQIIQFI